MKKIKTKFRKNNLVIALAAAVLVVIGGVFFAKSFASTAYDISQVGSITSFSASLNPTTDLNGATVPYGSQFLFSAVNISGIINNPSSLSVGDVINIPISASNSSAFGYAGGDVASTLSLGGGTFGLYVDSSGIHLSVTSKPTSAAAAVFSLKATSNAGQLISANYQSTSSTWTMDGNSITFSNQPYTTVTPEASAAKTTGATNSGVIASGLYTTSIYNYLLNNPNATASQIETAFPSLNLTANNVLIATLTPSAGSAITSVGSPSTGQTNVFDTMPDGNSLSVIANNGPSLTGQTFTQVSCPAGASAAAITALLPTQGEWCAVQNADGSWTAAVNRGPVIGNSFTYNASATNSGAVANFPNTAANIAKNQQLITSAQALGLYPEYNIGYFPVQFASDVNGMCYNYTVVNSNQTMGNTGTSSQCNAAGQGATAQGAPGQTAIDVHYVDGNANPLAQDSETFGWPTDNTAGQATTTASVSPVNITGYSLVTDLTALSSFAASNSLNGSQVLSKAASVAYPTIASNSSPLNLYYVFAKNSYTASFNSNGGSSVAAQSVPYQAAVAQPADPTRTGYTFAGWFSDSALTTAYNFSAPMPANNITLFAKWTANAYQIQFDANSGTGTMSNQAMTYDTAANLTKNTFAKTGYTFAGWSTSADATSAQYADGASVNNLATNGNVTLYAVWAPDVYTGTDGKGGLSFNANAPAGATISGSMSSQTVTYDANVTLAKNAFSATGYTFTGWNSAADGSGTKYADAASFQYQIAGDLELFAQWTANKYTVHYDANGGAGSMSDDSATFGQPYTFRENSFTRDGYEFVGWNTASDQNGGTSYSANYKLPAYTFAKNLTLYAVWAPVPGANVKPGAPNTGANILKVIGDGLTSGILPAIVLAGVFAFAVRGGKFNKFSRKIAKK